MVAPTSFFADYGCHVRILEEIRALQSRGHTVRVATYHNGDDLDDVDIRRSVGLPWRTRLMVGSSRHKIYLDAVLFLEVFRQALMFKPDLIHAHLHEGALIGSVVGRILRKPVVFDYQGSLTEEMLDHHFIRPGGLRERFMRRLERVIDRLPAIIIPSGTAAQEYLLKNGAPEHRVRLLVDAVDVTRFDPARAVSHRAEIRARLGIPDDARVVIYLGLLAEYQGTSLLIDAARELLPRRPDLWFVIAGYPGIEHYAQKAANLEGSERVLFPGRIPYAEAPELLAIGDVAVAPKLSSTEGNGKLFNYMAMGLPVVAIDTPHNRSVLGELGHLVRPHDPKALAVAIERALNASDGERAALRQRVTEHFSWSQRVHVLEEVYDTVLGEPARTPAVVTQNGHRPHAAVPSRQQASQVERAEVLSGSSERRGS